MRNYHELLKIGRKKENGEKKTEVRIKIKKMNNAPDMKQKPAIDLLHHGHGLWKQIHSRMNGFKNTLEPPPALLSSPLSNATLVGAIYYGK